MSGLFKKLAIIGTAAFIFGFAWGCTARAEISNDQNLRIKQLLKHELMKSFPNSSIRIADEMIWLRGNPPSTIEEVQILSESGRGKVNFIARGLSESQRVEAEGMVGFGAYVAVLNAVQRIFPGTQLQAGMFSAGEVDVSQGMARELRGVVLSKDTDVSNLEARQTILEGQFATTTAVQRVPDVKKGQSLQIKLISGDVVLSTPGTAEEPGYLNGIIHVQTLKSKKELVGKLSVDGTVEVKL